MPFLARQDLSHFSLMMRTIFDLVRTLRADERFAGLPERAHFCHRLIDRRAPPRKKNGQETYIAGAGFSRSITKLAAIAFAIALTLTLREGAFAQTACAPCPT